MKDFNYYSTNTVHPYPGRVMGKELDAYREEQQSLKEEFKTDVYREFGVGDNPKREKCFDLAWSFGHSAGYQEVYNYFSDFVELIE